MSTLHHVRLTAIVIGALVCLGSLTSLACAAEPAIPADSTAVLNAIQESLGKNATFTVKNNKAFQLLENTKLAVLKTNLQNAPTLTLDVHLHRRAFDVAIRSLAATRIPKDFLELDAKRKNNKPRAGLTLAPGVSPDATAFDWRTERKVTPVRTYLDNTGQGGCGCCWCFAAIAAFEGNHLVAYGGNSAEINASVQHILNCGHTGGCSGDWYYTAWAFMETQGSATEADVPYRGVVNEADCNATAETPYRVETYGLVSTNDKIPDRTAIKVALCRFGPLAVAVNATEAFTAYDDGVFNETPSDPEGPINHAVTLIGWDDDKNAWLIKNSWGSDWGSTGGIGSDKGYMWINYDSNNIGYAAAWVASKE